MATENRSLFNRKGILTEAEALAKVNEYLAQYELAPVTRQAWGQSIRPLLEKEGDAETSGGKRGQWFYDGAQLWRWKEYIAKRAVLIQLGQWSKMRPFSAEDMGNLVNSGVLDGEIDHPVFKKSITGETNMYSATTHEQNQALIKKFRTLVESGQVQEASELYDNAERYVDEDVPLGRFGNEAIAIAKANNIRLNDSNVEW
jgi:hypothetical protein